MTKSLLRFPGGKSRKSEEISEYFKNFNVILSPFLGGGSVELYLTNLDKMVISSDIDEQLINFWQTICVEETRDEMYSYVKEYYDEFHSDISKEEKRTLFYELRDGATDFIDVKGAAQYFIVNRVSFSGLGLRGGFSEWSIKAELGPLVLKRMKEWKKPKGFEIPECMSYEKLLDEYPNLPVFGDPPYYLKKGFLYPHHKDFNHEKFAEYLKKRNSPFMLTYNDCTEIRELYSCNDILIEERSWTYSMAKGKVNEGKARQGNELFISRGIK